MIGKHLVHVSFNVMLEVPGNNEDNVFLVVFGIYLEKVFVGDFYKLYDLSIVREG